MLDTGAAGLRGSALQHLGSRTSRLRGPREALFLCREEVIYRGASQLLSLCSHHSRSRDFISLRLCLRR
jgi:hypothetical protein